MTYTFPLESTAILFPRSVDDPAIVRAHCAVPDELYLTMNASVPAETGKLRVLLNETVDEELYFPVTYTFPLESTAIPFP